MENNEGLRNPGIKNYNKKNCIVSISLLEENDFDDMFYYLYYLKYEKNILGIEINISCPNYHILNVTKENIQDLRRKIGPVILKLPHDVSEFDLDNYCQLNSDYIHISNTKKTDRGALSGISLQEKNIQSIKYIKSIFPNKKIIAGGGIYSIEDILKYKEAGAQSFSLGTALINPFNTIKIINQWSQYQRLI